MLDSSLTGDPSFLKRARAHLLAGEFDAALAITQQALKADPNNLGANILCARTHIEARRYDEAESLLTGLISQFPDASEPPMFLASLKIRQEKWTDALVHAEHALKMDPSIFGAHVMQSRIYMELGRHNEAEHQLTALAVQYPQAKEPPMMLARLQATRGNWAKALAHAEAALVIDPDHLPAHLLCTRMLINLDQADEAENKLQDLANAFPKATAPLIKLAQLETERGNWKEATAYAEDARQRDPADIGAKILRRRLSQEAGAPTNTEATAEMDASRSDDGAAAVADSLPATVRTLRLEDPKAARQFKDQFAPDGGAETEHNASDGTLGFGSLHYSLVTNLRPERALVIGSRFGYVPAAIAAALDVNGLGIVDFVDANYHNDREGAEVAFGGNGYWFGDPSKPFESSGLSQRIRAHIMRSDAFFANCSQTYGYIYLDGNHSYEGSKYDLDQSLQRLSPGGMVVMHDVMVKRGAFGVARTFSEIDASRYETLTIPIWPGLGIIRPRGDGEK